MFQNCFQKKQKFIHEGWLNIAMSLSEKVPIFARRIELVALETRNTVTWTLNAKEKPLLMDCLEEYMDP
jgi:hypothetical protein